MSFPALLNSRQIKPAKFDLNQVEQLWQGKLNFNYGEQAVIGTIACLLALLTPATDAKLVIKEAKYLWQQRSNLPFNHLFQ